MCWPFSPAATNALPYGPCALVFEVASKNFLSPRLDKLPGPCGGFPVSADPSRNLVLWGAVGRAEISRSPQNPSIHNFNNSKWKCFDVEVDDDENVLTVEERQKGAREDSGACTSTPASSTAKYEPSKSTENQRGILKKEMRMPVCQFRQGRFEKQETGRTNASLVDEPDDESGRIRV